MNLQFSASAVKDLIRLREFIAIHNPQAAERISLRLRQAIGKLVLYPMMGHAVPEFENVREIVPVFPSFLKLKPLVRPLHSRKKVTYSQRQAGYGYGVGSLKAR
jgi:plasmid stabilization system protein ParE